MATEKDMQLNPEHDEHMNDAPHAKEGQELNVEPVMDDNWHRVSRRVVRKLDMTLMPMIWLLYLFNYLDRNSIS